MAHPVVIMAYEKSEAIGAAVAALEESGLEVVVLNTAKAKLVNFLGALAGATDADEEDEQKEEEKDDTNGEDASKDKDPDEGLGTEDTTNKEPTEEVTTEGSIEDEKILIKIVEGSSAVLYPSKISVGAKTVYNLNESSFSFWPSAIGNEPIKGGINLSLDGIKEFIQVTFSEEIKNPPVLELGADLLAKLKS